MKRIRHNNIPAILLGTTFALGAIFFCPTAPAAQAAQAAPVVKKGAPVVKAAPAVKTAPAVRTKRGKITNTRSLTMANAAQEFRAFSTKWVYSVNRNHVKGKTRMQVVKLPNGTYLARYHAVNPLSVKRELKGTRNPKAPFVGKLKYVEQIFENTGKDVASARSGKFKVVKGINIVEIFCRTDKGWQ